MNALKYEVNLYKKLLDENENIPKWCEKLDEILQVQNLCISGIDIDSDSYSYSYSYSYVLFICQKDKLEILMKLATNIRHRIVLASQL